MVERSESESFSEKRGGKIEDQRGLRRIARSTTRLLRVPRLLTKLRKFDSSRQPTRDPYYDDFGGYDPGFEYDIFN